MAVDSLISHRLPLKELPRGIEVIEGGRENVRKVMILPNRYAVHTRRSIGSNRLERLVMDRKGFPPR